MLSVKRDLCEDGRMVVSDPTPRFEFAVAAWLAAQRSANTRSAYESDLRTYQRWFVARVDAAADPVASTAHDVRAFREALEAGGSRPATVGRRLAAISSFFRFAGVPIAIENPVQATHRPAQQPKSDTTKLTPVECREVWRAAMSLGPRPAAIVGLVLFDGLKAGEIVPLDRRHVVVEPRRTTVVLARRGIEMIVEVDRRTATALTRVLAEARDRRPVVPLMLGNNPTREPARITRFGVDYLVKRVGVAARLTSPLTTNMLRSTHIANAHASGSNVDEVRESAGHASVRTTLRHLP